MPNYYYECAACSHKFQEFQTMSEKALSVCPKCKKNKLERLISGGSGVVFKGTGFYETDYKKKPNTSSSSNENKGASGSSSDGSKSSSSD